MPVVFARYGAGAAIGSSSSSTGWLYACALGCDMGAVIDRLGRVAPGTPPGPAEAPCTATCFGGGPNEAGSLSVVNGAEACSLPGPPIGPLVSLPLPTSFACGLTLALCSSLTSLLALLDRLYHLVHASEVAACACLFLVFGMPSALGCNTLDSVHVVYR